MKNFRPGKARQKIYVSQNLFSKEDIMKIFKTQKGILIIFLAIILLAPFISAQTKGKTAKLVEASSSISESEQVDLGIIPVEKKTIEKIEEFIISGVNDSGQSTVVISSNRLENNSRVNVVDTMKDISGVYFNKYALLGFMAGSDAPSVFKIRGIGEKPNSGILVVVDGRPQSIGIWRHPLFDTLSLDSVESVEVIKGPGGLEYGNQAVGGVIRIKTKRKKVEGIKTTVGAGYGMYNSQDYFVHNTLKKGKFDYSISAGYKYTSGKVDNADGYQQHYHLGLGFEINKNWYISAGGDYGDTVFHNPGPTNGGWAIDDGDGKTVQGNFDFGIEHEYKIIQGELLAYGDLGYNHFYSDSSNIYANYGVKVKETLTAWKGSAIKIGFEWQRFGGRYNNYPSGGTQSFTNYQNDYGVYILINQKLLKEIFVLSGGLRYAYNDRWGEVYIPGGGLKIMLFKNRLGFYGNVQKGYKTPEFGREIVSELSMFTPLYEVTKPEEYWQYETGLMGEISFFNYKVSLYQIDGKNLIQTEPNPNFPPPPMYIFQNTGSIQIRGIEFDFSILLFKKLKLGTFLSYLDPGKKTARLALLQGKGYIFSQPWKPLTLNLEMEYAQYRYDSDERKDKLDDYITVNANITYTLMLKKTSLSFYLDIINLFNRKYLIKTGYPAPGTLVKGGLVLKI